MLSRITRHQLFSLRSATLAAVAVGCLDTGAMAQSSTAPMPFHRRTAGWLVSDTTLSKVYLCRDLTGDGTFNQPGEVVVFFDGAGNAGGQPLNATDNVFAMYQASSGVVYIASDATNTIYAVRDNDLNADAQGVTESRVYFSDTGVVGGNTAGISLPTPNGLCGDANAIFICNAGTTGFPQDGIIRVRDGDSDGNANGATESAYFCDASTLFGAGSSPFTCSTAGGDLFFADLRGGSADVIYRCHDGDANNIIAAAEFNVYLLDGFNGAPASFACKSDGTNIYTAESTASTTQTVFRLHDDDASGSIDVTTEAVLVWSEANLPAGSIMGNSFDIDVAPRSLLVVSNVANGRELILARDLDNNGVFLESGETAVALLNTANLNTIFPFAPRAVMAYGWPCAADFNMIGGITVADIFDFLAGWFAGNPRADFNGVSGLGVQDIFDFLAAWFTGC